MKYLKGDKPNIIKRSHKYKAYPNLYDLKTDKVNTEFENLRTILDTIKKLGNASTTQIWLYLDRHTQEDNNKVREYAQSKYESGDFTDRDRDKDIRKKIKATITKRTIQTAVKRLWEKYGLIEKNGKQYSLSSNALYDMRYFPKDFAMPAIYSLVPFPVKTVEQSLEEFIDRFGAYIIFTFIETMHPITDTTVNLLNNERLLNSWLVHAIPIKEMFGLFSSLYRVENSNSMTIKKLTQVIEKKYPEIYKELKDAKSAAVKTTRPISPDTGEPMSSLDLGKALKQIRPGKSPAGAFGWNRAIEWMLPKDWPL